MKAFITGIAGQDGSYLAEYLLSLGYEVYGIIRRNSTPEHQEDRIAHLNGKIKTYYGDVTDLASLLDTFHKVKPDEVYNLAAQSHVRISSDIPHFTGDVNAIGALNVLTAARMYARDARYYQASSSEMFGSSVDPDGYQRETTPMHPVSPYGISKLYAYHMTRHFRKAYDMHACNGILFNHESPRRASNFVTNKVVKAAVRIKLGLQDHLEMGNLDSYRDWGHSKDYVRAMHAIVNHSEPGDFVVATGETRSVRDMCEYVFERLGMDYKKFVEINGKYFRPEELPFLRGDATKIRNTLKWGPEYSFEMLMDEMIDHWCAQYNELIVLQDEIKKRYTL